ncbi:MAG: hypothetical protein N3I35_03135 [Clostridia bacterium]|nr:hypothetical protein [Clostridia bacterium]
MRVKTRLSAVAISAAAVVCTVLILCISIAFGFYFGPEKDRPKSPALIIKNENSYYNTLPEWVHVGKGGYKLVFAVNAPEPGEDYSREENPSAGRTPMVFAVLDPLKKEICQVENNIYRDNVDDESSKVSLTPGKRYGTIMLGNGMFAYEDDGQYIDYGVYFTFNDKAEPVLSSYGGSHLAYISQGGLFGRPFINLYSLAGGMFSGGGFIQGQPEQKKEISIAAGSLVGWVGNYELLFSTSRLNRKFQYVDMHDLWRVPAQGGKPRKIRDNVHNPLFYSDDAVIVFAEREENNSYSVQKMQLDGHVEKMVRFRYTPKTDEMPALSITNRKQNQNFDICYTADAEGGKKSIMAVNSQSRDVRTLVKGQDIIGPVISSYKIDGGEGKYMLYFSEEEGSTKAYVIDNMGNVQSEIYGMLASAPSESYRKAESE